MGDLPSVPRLPTNKDVKASTTQRFVDESSDSGIVVVRVNGDLFDGSSVRQPVTPEQRARKVQVEFGQASPTVSDLMDSLTEAGVQIAYRLKDGDGTTMQKPLPFTRFSGNLGGLLDALRTGIGLVFWQEGDTVFLSDSDRYSITLPQDKDVLDAVTTSLTSLGVTDAVSSVDGGKIIYTATPTLQDEVVSPFLKRLAKNLSTINMQVAIVNLSLTDKSSQGFDWSKFSAAVDTHQNVVTAAETVDPAATPASVLSDLTANKSVGSVVDLTSNQLFIGATSIGAAFGVKAVESITAAVQYLSTFGNASVSQNVDLRTLSGKQVSFNSGGEIPYVSGVASTTTGQATTGSAQTSKAETGLKVSLTPRFDGDSKIVTVGVKVEINDVVKFIQLDAGSQVGTLTQPQTTNQTLESMVQMRAGQTVVLGGLQYDREQYDGNDPVALRRGMTSSSRSFGVRSQDVQRTSLFIILRPTVTLYQPTGVSGDGALK